VVGQLEEPPRTKPWAADTNVTDAASKPEGTGPPAASRGAVEVVLEVGTAARVVEVVGGAA
jgi:hypothetical protein